MTTICGQYAIPNGVDGGTVSGLILTGTPRRAFLFMQKPAGGFDMFASLVIGTLTATGFTFNLSGVTDSANYALEYLLLF